MRPFSTTATTSFFFNRPSAPTFPKLLSELVKARHAERLDLVTKLYPTLIAAARDPSVPPQSVPIHSLRSFMRFVAKTNRYTLLVKMFDDLQAFGWKPDGQDHHILLRGLVQAGKNNKASQWIERMEATYGIKPSVSDWNVLLSGHKRTGNAQGMKEALEAMRAKGVEPNIVTYNTMIAGLFKYKDVEGVREVVKDMEVAGVKPDYITDTTLLHGFLTQGELGSARGIKARLELDMQLPPDSRVDPAGPDESAVNALIDLEMVDNGFEAGRQAARRYRDEGRQLDGWTLNSLINEGGKGIKDAREGIALVEDLEEVVGVSADRRTWSAVIVRMLQKRGGVDEALKLYQEARDRSIKPDSAMIQPLLTALLTPSPTATSFPIAKSLYEDLATSSRAYDLSPDNSIYITLLRACADLTEPDLEYSRTLLADMRERGVRLESQTVAWHIVALMRVAKDHGEAFSAYDGVRALDVQSLDVSGYNTIIAAFTSLTFAPLPPQLFTSRNPAPPAPASYIQEFLADMRSSLHPPSEVTYSTLLSYYSRTATASASNIAHLHSLIKVDINIDPDIALFNSLMAAYSRVGAHGATLGIWDSMRANRAMARIDNTSVSIVLDTCGYQGGDDGLKRGSKIWSELTEERFSLNLKNWDSWIEALCRLAQYDEAERLVFDEMGKGGNPEAGVSTLETFLKFSRRDEGRWQNVRERIQSEKPNMWAAVKDVALAEPSRERGGV